MSHVTLGFLLLTATTTLFRNARSRVDNVSRTGRVV